MATRKATIKDVEGAFRQLSNLLPDENLALEHWGPNVRIERADHSCPFGRTWMTKGEIYSAIWFAIDALLLAQ